jgi:hypothetical protein
LRRRLLSALCSHAGFLWNRVRSPDSPRAQKSDVGSGPNRLCDGVDVPASEPLPDTTVSGVPLRWACRSRNLYYARRGRHRASVAAREHVQEVSFARTSCDSPAASPSRWGRAPHRAFRPPRGTLRTPRSCSARAASRMLTASTPSPRSNLPRFAADHGIEVRAVALRVTGTLSVPASPPRRAQRSVPPSSAAGSPRRGRALRRRT